MSATDPRPVVPDRYVIVLKDGVSDVPGLARTLVGAVGGKLHFVYEDALKGFAATLSPAAVSQLQRDPRIAYIDPVVLMMPDQIQPGAPWHLDRIDQHTPSLDGAFNYFQTGAGVHLYIIDSGIRKTHSEFEGRALDGATFIHDGRGTEDCFGHGTAVAGVAGGRTYGVAKQVTLYAVRIDDCVGGTPSDTIVAGINWVAGNRMLPAVANISYGGPASTSVDAAVNGLINSGVTVSVAAGNDNVLACNGSPPRVAAAITVGASDINDSKATFSNFGSCLDLFAPGVDVSTAGIASDVDVVSVPGTSFAAPQVAGVAALILSENGTLSPAYIQSVIKESATKNVLTNIGAGSPNMLLYSIHTFVDISGRSGQLDCGTYTWSPAPLGGTGTFTNPAWYEKRSTVTTWSFVSSNWSYSRSMPLWPYQFLLRLDVSSYGDVVSDSTHLIYSTCGRPH
jgi:subtilisin family serine protease